MRPSRIGDGSAAESDFRAGLVFASTYRASVELNIVNNQCAIAIFQGITRGRSPADGTVTWLGAAVSESMAAARAARGGWQGRQ